MKKKVIVGLILLIVFVAILLTGCVDNSATATISDQPITPKVMSLKSEGNGGDDYYYIIDKNTHVVYLKYKDGYQSGMAVMFKADGTPMLAEDLGIKVID